MTVHVLPFLKRMSISVSLVEARIALAGRLRSILRFPVCGLTADQTLFRA